MSSSGISLTGNPSALPEGILSRFSILVAWDAEGGIAKKGYIPWYYPEDLSFFRKKPLGEEKMQSFWEEKLTNRSQKSFVLWEDDFGWFYRIRLVPKTIQYGGWIRWNLRCNF